MNPQDPNFPSEFPPVPPSRDGDSSQPQADQGTADLGSDSRAGAGVPHDVAAASDLATPSVPRMSSDRPPTVPPQPQPTAAFRRQPPRSGAAPARAPDRGVASAEDVWTDADIPYQPKRLSVIDQLLLLLAEGATVWKKVLRWVRSQLPADLQRQLSDAMLTAIALGLLMLLLALWNPLGAGGGEQVADAPLPPDTTAEPGPSDRFAEPTAEPSGETVGAEADPAPPVPTPEQSLIADIQDRVSRISRSYGAGLIQSVEVNLPQSTLGVNLDESWYGLLTTQQNEAAQDIYAQAQGLEFGTLQLRDPSGVVVARNPVVGPNMVVLRRLR